MSAADYTNLDQAVECITKIRQYRDVQKELRGSFVHDELDGGWKAALEHPLYLQAEVAIEALQEQLRLLI